MASTRVSMSKLQFANSELLCKICNNLISDSRMLSCTHYFCKKCMPKIAIDRKLQCPTCRAVTPLPERGYDALKVHWHVQQAAEAWKKVALEEQEVFCENCKSEGKEVPATKYCRDCKTRFCDDCSQAAHSLNIHKSHHMFPATAGLTNGQSGPPKNRMSCPAHPDQLRKVMCRNCNDELCPECSYDRAHRGHTCEPLEEAADGAKDTLHDCKMQLGGIRSTWLPYLEDAQSALKSFQKNSAQARETLDSVFAEAQMRLQQRKEELLATLTHLETATVNQLQTNVENFEGLTLRLEAVTNFINLAFEKKENVDFLDALGPAVQNLAETKQFTGEVSTASYDLDLPIQDFVQSINNFGRVKVVLQAYPVGGQVKELKYHSDFDENGVFYYIGTNRLKEPYQNPAKFARVFVTRSSNGTGMSQDCLERGSPKPNWTEDVANSYYQLDLGATRQLRPNYYTLRGSGLRDGSFQLMSWKLEGSPDGSTFTVLSQHDKDRIFVDGAPSCSWPIEALKTTFRYFRVTQTGRNSSGTNHLMIGGIELYGWLREIS